MKKQQPEPEQILSGSEDEHWQWLSSFSAARKQQQQPTASTSSTSSTAEPSGQQTTRSDDAEGEAILSGSEDEKLLLIFRANSTKKNAAAEGAAEEDAEEEEAEEEDAEEEDAEEEPTAAQKQRRRPRRRHLLLIHFRPRGAAYAECKEMPSYRMSLASLSDTTAIYKITHRWCMENKVADRSEALFSYKGIALEKGDSAKSLGWGTHANEKRIRVSVRCILDGGKGKDRKGHKSHKSHKSHKGGRRGHKGSKRSCHDDADAP